MSSSSGGEQPPLDDEGHEQVAVAVFVEQHGHLVAVVALHGSLAPAAAGHAGADREWLGHGLRGYVPAVVVARATRADIVLAEGRKQKRAPAPAVLGVAAHHLQPGAPDLP